MLQTAAAQQDFLRRFAARQVERGNIIGSFLGIQVIQPGCGRQLRFELHRTALHQQLAQAAGGQRVGLRTISPQVAPLQAVDMRQSSRHQHPQQARRPGGIGLRHGQHQRRLHQQRRLKDSIHCLGNILNPLHVPRTRSNPQQHRPSLRICHPHQHCRQARRLDALREPVHLRVHALRQGGR